MVIWNLNSSRRLGKILEMQGRYSRILKRSGISCHHEIRTTTRTRSCRRGSVTRNSESSSLNSKTPRWNNKSAIRECKICGGRWSRIRARFSISHSSWKRQNRWGSKHIRTCHPPIRSWDHKGTSSITRRNQIWKSQEAYRGQTISSIWSLIRPSSGGCCSGYWQPYF